MAVEKCNKDDIYTYVETELKDFGTLLELRDKIIERSSGVFLWVRLVIEKLKHEENSEPGRHISILEQKLREIPSRLEEVFDDLLKKLHPQHRPRSTFLIQLVLCARRRLSAEEIAAVISFHPETQFKKIKEWDKSSQCIKGVENQMAMVVKLSGGLLEFDRTKYPKCQFIHESARDYFLRYKGFQNLSVLDENTSIPGWCHSAIATASVNYLRAISVEAHKSTAFGESFATGRGMVWDFINHPGRNLHERRVWEPKSPDSIWKRYRGHRVKKSKRIGTGCTASNASRESLIIRGEALPFLEYSLRYVYEHVQMADEKDVSQETTLRHLDQMDAKQKSFFFMMSDSAYFDPDGWQLYNCCTEPWPSFKNFSRLIGMENDPRPIINRRHEWTREYPLLVACNWRFSGQLVELFLQNGAEIEVRNGWNETALHRAVEEENVDAVKLLLAYGANTESRSCIGSTAMHHAIRSNEIIGLLLAKGAQLDAKDDYGWTPLIWAGWCGQFKSFPHLINAGADVNHKALDGETALYKALEFFFEEGSFKTEGLYEAVQCCVTNGLDLRAKDSSERTLWSYCMMNRGELFWEGEIQLWKRLTELLRPAEEGGGEKESPETLTAIAGQEVGGAEGMYFSRKTCL